MNSSSEKRVLLAERYANLSKSMIAALSAQDLSKLTRFSNERFICIDEFKEINSKSEYLRVNKDTDEIDDLKLKLNQCIELDEEILNQVRRIKHLWGSELKKIFKGNRALVGYRQDFKPFPIYQSYSA